MSEFQNDTREWLETDGFGGFACGTVCGRRTRRYHALLLAATRPPAGRVVLVNGLDIWVETPTGTYPITTQRYVGGVDWPSGDQYLREFTIDPWPTWEFALGEQLIVRQQLFIPNDVMGTALGWSVRGDRAGVRLHARPFLSVRDYHTLHQQNSNFRFESIEADSSETCVAWRPYPDMPLVLAESNATYEPHPEWYRDFLYEQEQQRGLDCLESLASPGEFHWDLNSDDAVLLLGAGKRFSERVGDSDAPPVRVFLHAAVAERKRRSGSRPIDRSAGAYFAHRDDGTTIIAGFPWFTDWGRDTFIAIRGLCLQPDRWLLAKQILLAWAGTVSEGMLPNRFPDSGDQPEYNSVDASLWYIIAVNDYCEAIRQSEQQLTPQDQATLNAAVQAILTGYSRGTRYGIRLDDDGLISAGQPGVQLTWMDAKVSDWVVTPRIGKPVEIQALWLSALHVATTSLARSLGSDGQSTTEWSAVLERGLVSFTKRFWNDEDGYLYDVVDVDHQPGAVDKALRPNQILAVGGLPLQLLDDERARRVVDTVEARLLTPLGLRSLDPSHPDYRPRYEGGVWERDGAYHQGTVWAWLIGPFVEAWVRVRGDSSEAKREARHRFVEPLFEHLGEAGLGHISEIADAEPPYTPRGCPFQAWSLGELLRLEDSVLRDESSGQADIENLEVVGSIGLSST